MRCFLLFLSFLHTRSYIHMQQISDWRPSWTDSHTPERVVVDRITRLARASLAALLQWMEGAVKEEEVSEYLCVFASLTASHPNVHA